MKVGKRSIGPGNPVFIIGELSGNHNQDYGRAIEIIDAAIDAGVDAIKLQTYTADTHTIDSPKKWFKLGKGTLWAGHTIYDLYKMTYTPWEWQPKLQEHVRRRKKILFSAPTDSTSLALLEHMDVPLLKVASFELPDLQLLAAIGKTKKPVILSRGMATEAEIRRAISTLRKHGSKDIAVLHCVSAYPAEPAEMNLRTIPDIAKRFGVIAGLSDHTLGTTIPTAAVALGASIIEKHICLRRSDGGADSAFSLEPREVAEMVASIRTTEAALGKPTYTPTKKEREHAVFRRSLFIVEDVKRGELLTEHNVRCIRPGYGLEPQYLSRVLGRRATRNLERGTPLAWNMFVKKR